MSSVSVSLPPHLKDFIDHETVEKNLSSAADLILHLVQAEYFRKNKARVELQLGEGISSGPTTPMTEQDWEGIKREGLATLAKEKKNAGKGGKTSRRPKRPA